jgi:hypothetical protein
MNSRFHKSLFLTDNDWVKLTDMKKVSPRMALKMYITSCAKFKDTCLPENCVFRVENVIDIIETLYLNERIKLKYYDKGQPDKFYQKLEKKIYKYCKKGFLRPILINGTQYYEAN